MDQPPTCFSSGQSHLCVSGDAAGCHAEHPACACSPFVPRRQAERRDDIKEVLQHWGYARTVDMSGAEKEGKYFEVRRLLVRFCMRCSWVPTKPWNFFEQEERAL